MLNIESIAYFVLWYRHFSIPLQTKTNKETKKYKIMKEKIKDFGEFNGWRGCMGLYFNTKQLRPLKKYGITAATTLEEAYNILNE